jgi:hypothetical protein
VIILTGPHRVLIIIFIHAFHSDGLSLIAWQPDIDPSTRTTTRTRMDGHSDCEAVLTVLSAEEIGKLEGNQNWRPHLSNSQPQSEQVRTPRSQFFQPLAHRIRLLVFRHFGHLGITM